MPRGRSYPALSLGDAIKRARELYEKDKRAYVPTDMAVKAWGYNSLNGRSLRALSAVRQYGLLDDGPDKKVRVSDRALAILVEPDGSKDQRQALHDAAMSPAIFGELLEQYGDELPRDEVMVAHLVRQEGFSEEAGGRLVRTFLDTLDLVRGNSAGYTGEQEDENGGEDESEPPASPPGRKTPPGGRMEFSWPLSGNAEATLTVSRDLDPDDIETLSAYFEIAKKALGKAAASRSAESDPGDGADT